MHFESDLRLWPADPSLNGTLVLESSQHTDRGHKIYPFFLDDKESEEKRKEFVRKLDAAMIFNDTGKENATTRTNTLSEVWKLTKIDYTNADQLAAQLQKPTALGKLSRALSMRSLSMSPHRNFKPPNPPN